jgi:hypothetical protein|nr:MAG TPA: hypothetical protein [Caudoviricetes sp.]
MNLEVGMKLELIKDLDCGITVIAAGELFEIKSILNKVSLMNPRIGVGVFDVEEVREYFKEHVEEIKTDEDVKRIIYSDKVTVVILNSGIKGVAKCLENDTYNKEIGYRVAYLKAKIKEFNKELKRY